MSNTPKTLDDIHAVLCEVLAAVRATKPAVPSGALPSLKPDADAPVPQPSAIIDDPGAVEIHFGKNTGKRIDDLTDRQLHWYSLEPEPRLKSDGTPFPPREQDVALRNACRQLWHDKKGTLGGAKKPAAAKSAPAPVDDENIPF